MQLYQHIVGGYKSECRGVEGLNKAAVAYSEKEVKRMEIIEAVAVQKVVVKVVLEDEDGMEYSFAIETSWSDEMELDEIAREVSAAISMTQAE